MRTGSFAPVGSTVAAEPKSGRALGDIQIVHLVNGAGQQISWHTVPMAKLAAHFGLAEG